MTVEKFANAFWTTLTSEATAAVTTIHVAAAAPATLQGGQFRAIIGSEIVLVTSGQETTTWTVTRGVEGTTAAVHGARSWVANVLTAALPSEVADARGGYATLGEKVRGGRFDVRDYGSLGGADDTATFQAAVDAAEVVGGVVPVPPGDWVVNNLILKTGVTLTGGSGMFGYGPGSIRQATLRGTAAGWVIDTPATAISNCAIVGLNVAGAGAGVASGGIRFRNVAWGKITNVQVDAFANEGLLIASPSVACVVEDVLTTNVVLDRARATVIGAVDIDGTDHFLSRIEATASLSALSNAAFYIPAIAVRGSNHFLSNCIGEISDVGFYFAAGLCRVSNCRADLNFGHGFYIAGQAEFSTCTSVNNGQEATNTYSGWYVAAALAQGNQIIGCRAVSTGAKAHKYGLHDLASYAAVTSRTTVIGFNSAGHGTAPALNANDYWSGMVIAPHRLNVADATAVPDVGQATIICLFYATATDITDFSGGVYGQTITVFGAATVTIKNNANIQTNTNADKAMSALNTPLRFTKMWKWIEDA